MKRPEVPLETPSPPSPPSPPLHPAHASDPTVDARAVDPRAAAMRAPAEPTARWVVADRYEILGLLGSGGMGTVYRARDRELDDVIALKMLKKQIAAAPGILDRFRREVKLARRVTHRNVARTFDIGEHAGAKFLTMEFIDGEMLGTMLRRRGRLRVAEVTRLGRDICAGLSAAHAAGVLHRDLKPANVVVARDGRAVITDFGIARALDLGASAQTAGGVVGTPAYMAPEQLEGAPDSTRAPTSMRSVRCSSSCSPARSPGRPCRRSRPPSPSCRGHRRTYARCARRCPTRSWSSSSDAWRAAAKIASRAPTTWRARSKDSRRCARAPRPSCPRAPPADRRRAMWCGPGSPYSRS